MKIIKGFNDFQLYDLGVKIRALIEEHDSRGYPTFLAFNAESGEVRLVAEDGLGQLMVPLAGDKEYKVYKGKSRVFERENDS